MASRFGRWAILWAAGALAIGCGGGDAGGADGIGGAGGTGGAGGAAGEPAGAAPPDSGARADAALPGAAGGPDPCGAVADLPGICPPHGLYDAPVMVRLTAAIGAPIQYTVDGTEPSATNGMRYAAPFRVEGTADRAVVAVRAVTIPNGAASARSAVATYVFPSLVVGQSRNQPGLPTVWGDPARGAKKSRPADYEMDPRVITAADRAKAIEGLSAIPTVSIVMNKDDLWSTDRGLYMNPEATGRPAERRASAELISRGDPNGFQIPCGIRIQGNSSPIDWKSPKLSMRLYFRAEYGAAKLKFPVFPDSRLTEFDTLVLDAHLNNTWIHPTDEAQRLRGVYVRDAFASDLQRALGSYGVHHRYVHVYLNGLYWGLYHVHERPDEHYAAATLGGSADEYDVIKHNPMNIVNGDGTAYQEMLALARGGLADPVAYEKMKGYLNIDHFIDYMLLNFYLGNTDWDYSNWYTFRRRMNGSGFYFISWDAELILGDVNYNATMPVTNPTAANTSIGKPREIYSLLRRNADFLARWNKRRDELLKAPDGALVAAKALPLLMKRIAEVRPAILLESARWGDVARATPFGPVEFEAEVQRLAEQYFPRRSEIVLQQLP